MTTTEIHSPTIPLSTYGLRLLAVGVVGHPLEYVRFLIQIGHEPLPPYHAKTIFGRNMMRLPSFIEYIMHIKNRDGWFGLYRGVVPKVLGHIIGSGAAANVTNRLQLRGGHEYMDNSSLSEKQSNSLLSVYDEWQSMVRELNLPDVATQIEELKLEYLVLALKKSVVERLVFISVSHPFVVISARMMASFVGREEGYRGVFSSIRQIYQDDGILGFFSGYIPRLVGDVVAVVVTALTIYTVNNYVIKEREFQTYTRIPVGYFINSGVHPFAVVSSCMAVNNSSLKAGKPPNMVIFPSWINCWQHLKLNNQLQRGAGVFMRPYVGDPVGSLRMLTN